MMSVRAEEAERLAKIFREIFALSETNQPNHPKSAATKDSIKIVDAQCQSETHRTGAPHGKQASAEPEDQDYHR
jgi:hypothetical protein